MGKNTVLPPIPAIDSGERVSTPHVIPFLRQHHVVKVSAGGDHSFAVRTPPGDLLPQAPRVSLRLALGHRCRAGLCFWKKRHIPAWSYSRTAVTFCGHDEDGGGGRDAGGSRRAKGASDALCTCLPAPSHAQYCRAKQHMCFRGFRVHWCQEPHGHLISLGEAQVGPEPVQVVGLRWKQVVDVSCGDAHTLACCYDGSVIAWGMGNSGRLGLGHFKSIPHPTKVPMPNDETCVSVAAGYYHSLVLTDDGQILAVGLQCAWVTNQRCLRSLHALRVWVGLHLVRDVRFSAIVRRL